MADQDKKEVTLEEFNPQALELAGINNAELFALIKAGQDDPSLARAVDKLTSTLSKISEELNQEKQDHAKTKLELDEAGHDALTGLPGRKLFLEKATDNIKQIERYGDRSAVIVLMDLDGFKEINDKHGHKAGDDALVEVGKRLSNTLRATDAIGRWGGDEIILLLTYDFGEEFNEGKVRSRIRESLCGLYYGDKADPSPVGTSIGFAVMDTETIEEASPIQEAERFIHIADKGENSVYVDKEEKDARQFALREAIINEPIVDNGIGVVSPPKIPGPGST